MRWRAAAVVVLAGATALTALARAQADARAVSAAAAPTYSVVDLGGVDSRAMAINRAGHVAGYQRGDPFERAFRWFDGEKTLLPTFDANAYAINAAGDMAGTRDDCENGYCPRATLWVGNTATDLGTLGGNRSFASGMNDSRVVVGHSAIAGGGTYGGEPIVHAFVWEDGVMRDLGTLGGTLGSAEDVNNHGKVVGFAHSAAPPCTDPDPSDCPEGGPYHAFLWTPSPVGGSGTMVDLGTLPGPYPGTPLSYAYAINDRGQVVGRADFQVFTTARHAFLWEKGQWRDLGALAPGHGSEARGLNESTQVVGNAGRGDGSIAAFLWQNGVMSDLNTLIAPDSGWRLVYAHGISDTGRIVGYGRRTGSSEWRAFLLVPLVHLTAFAVVPGTIPGSRTALGRVTLDRPAPPGGATVALASTFANPNPPASVPQTVTVPAGSSSRAFPIPTVTVKRRVTGRITASYNGESRTATLTVRPIGVSRVFLSPNPADRGATVTGTVLLEARAAPGPITVSLTSSAPSLALFPLSTITVGGPTRSNPAGSISRTFTLQVNPHPGLGNKATITASANGVAASATLRVKP